MSNKAKPPYERQDRALRALIASGMALRGIKDKRDLSAPLGVCGCTVYERLNNPGGFRLEELRRLVALFGLTQEDVWSIFK